MVYVDCETLASEIRNSYRGLVLLRVFRLGASYELNWRTCAYISFQVQETGAVFFTRPLLYSFFFNEEWR